MLNILFLVSYFLLWFLVLILFAAVFLLYRYHGTMLLESREGRLNQGPDLNKVLPVQSVESLRGETFRIGQPTDTMTLIFFAQTTCKICHNSKESLSLFAEKFLTKVQVILVCAGKDKEVEQFAQELAPEIRVIPDSNAKIMAQLHISNTPFTVLLDTQGVVQKKGVTANLDDFENYIIHVQNSNAKLPLEYIRNEK